MKESRGEEEREGRRRRREGTRRESKRCSVRKSYARRFTGMALMGGLCEKARSLRVWEFSMVNSVPPTTARKMKKKKEK